MRLSKSERLEMVMENIEKKMNEVDLEKFFKNLSRFKSHSYSFSNFFNACLQFSVWYPDRVVTQLGSASNFKKMGRRISKEDYSHKKLWILAPIIKQVEDKESPDKTFPLVVNYRSVPIYEISQTEGKEVSLMENLQFTKEQVSNLNNELKSKLTENGYKIYEQAMKPAQGGLIKTEITTEAKSIYLNSERSELDQIRTIIHEVSHDECKHFERREVMTSQQKECEAELTTIIMLNAVNVDSEYSHAYLKRWSESLEGKSLKELVSMSHVLKATEKIDKLLKSLPSFSK